MPRKLITRLGTFAAFVTAGGSLAAGRQCEPEWSTAVGTPGISQGYIGALQAFDDGGGEMLYAGGSFPSIAGRAGTPLIARGDYAVVTHRGSYDGLGEVYDTLIGSWLPSSGREPGDGPAFEIYRNSPRDTPPAELVTDVYVPLQTP